MQIISSDAEGVAVKANLSYIPVFRQISTENNAAYGEAANHDRKYCLYEPVIAPPSKGSATQSPHMEQSEENYYEIVD